MLRIIRFVGFKIRKILFIYIYTRYSVEGNMTEETMASTKLLSLGPLLSYFLDTSSAFTAMETPNLFLPSIASPWMDNFYKCILYGCVPSSVSSIFSTSLSGTRQRWRRHFAINAAESSNYVRWNGKIPQFDYILRISSLINTKHRYIYIYIHEYEGTQFGAMSS